MEIDKIKEIIDKGEEAKFVNKLRSYSFNEYTLQSKNFLAILLTLVECGTDKILLQQFLYQSILKLLPNIYSSEESKKDFSKFLITNSVFPYVNVSSVLRDFIIGVYDEKFLSKTDKDYNKLVEFKNELLNVNNHFLSLNIVEYLKENSSHSFNDIMSVFYSCVETLRAERRIKIDDKANKLLRDCLMQKPADYLQLFFRPYYFGPNKKHIEYYLHIGEPFFLQIFNNYETFLIFLEHSKKLTELPLVEDIIAYINKVRLLDGEKDRYQIFYSDLLKSGEIFGLYSPIAEDKYIKLKSDKHSNVHPECLPSFKM
jgi:hypothetical protein